MAAAGFIFVRQKYWEEEKKNQQALLRDVNIE
jgi:hypothetical protein